MSFFIAIRILLSVSASGVQKRFVARGGNSLGIWVATYAIMLPIAIAMAAPSWSSAGAGFWSNSLLAGVLDALGNLAMIAALRSADLSVFGPLNAIRPLLALLFGWIFLHEIPSARGVVGIVITVAGGVVLLKDDQRADQRPAHVWRMLGFRLLGFALSTVAAVFLKRAALVASAEMTLLGWIMTGLLCLGAFAVFNRKGIRPKCETSWLFGHALVFCAMQWLTIRIFQTTLLSYAFVFFQLGMVLQVVAGRMFFKEPHFGRRLLGCGVMIIGALCILWRV